MLKKDYEKLAQDVAEATEYIKKFKKSEEFLKLNDYGTCNFDSPMIFLEHANLSTLEQTLGKVNCSTYKSYTGAYQLGFDGLWCGQAMNRTTVAEKFVEFMKNKGWDCYVNYVTD